MQIRGAYNPEWIADGLSEESCRALIELYWRSELGGDVPDWRGPLMTFRRDAPPALTPLGMSVQSVLLRRMNAIAMETQRAETVKQGSVAKP